MFQGRRICQEAKASAALPFQMAMNTLQYHKFKSTFNLYPSAKEFGNTNVFHPRVLKLQDLSAQSKYLRELQDHSFTQRKSMNAYIKGASA